MTHRSYSSPSDYTTLVAKATVHLSACWTALMFTARLATIPHSICIAWSLLWDNQDIAHTARKTPKCTFAVPNILPFAAVVNVRHATAVVDRKCVRKPHCKWRVEKGHVYEKEKKNHRIPAWQWDGREGKNQLPQMGLGPMELQELLPSFTRPTP